MITRTRIPRTRTRQRRGHPHRLRRRLRRPAHDPPPSRAARRGARPDAVGPGDAQARPRAVDLTAAGRAVPQARQGVPLVPKGSPGESRTRPPRRSPTDTAPRRQRPGTGSTPGSPPATGFERRHPRHPSGPALGHWARPAPLNSAATRLRNLRSRLHCLERHAAEQYKALDSAPAPVVHRSPHTPALGLARHPRKPGQARSQSYSRNRDTKQDSTFRPRTYVAARQRLFIIVLHRTSVSDQLAMITPLTPLRSDNHRYESHRVRCPGRFRA